MGKTPDRTLVERAQRGDSEALGELWCRHRRWVAAVVIAHGPRDQLEDLMQEVMVAVIRGVGSVQDPGAWRPWLRRVALNVASGAGRQRSREQRAGARPLEDPDAVHDPAPERARLHAAAEDRVALVLELAHRLHADYREPLLLRCVDGQSQQEIADALGLPVTTIETRLARARRMLRQELARSQAEAEPVPAAVARPASTQEPVTQEASWTKAPGTTRQ